MIHPLRKHDLGGPPPKPRAKRTYPESIAQRSVIRWLRARPEWLWMRVENGAKRTPAQAARDLAMGMQKSAPDLWVCYRTRSAWLEMKAENGTVTPDQEEFHAQLRARGEIVLVGFGEVHAIQQLEAFAEMVNNF
jgi:hypothetical protein